MPSDRSSSPVAGDTLALSGFVATAAFFGGVAAAMRISDAPYPRPGSSAEDITRYFGDNGKAARISIGGQVVSAAALAVFAEAFSRHVAARSQRPALTAVSGRAGGAIAATTLVASALNALMLTRPGVARSGHATKIHHRAFRAGGAFHAPGIGLLAASVGVAGVQSGNLPRAMSAALLLVGAAGLLAPLSMAFPRAVWLIPLSRFPGLLLLTAAGITLARKK